MSQLVDRGLVAFALPDPENLAQAFFRMESGSTTGDAALPMHGRFLFGLCVGD